MPEVSPPSVRPRGRRRLRVGVGSLASSDRLTLCGGALVCDLAVSPRRGARGDGPGRPSPEPAPTRPWGRSFKPWPGRPSPGLARSSSRKRRPFGEAGELGDLGRGSPMASAAPPITRPRSRLRQPIPRPGHLCGRRRATESEKIIVRAGAISGASGDGGNG